LSLDANGIIMGEFGFITADDVYHVTVYATDENGNFKIISMKNIKLMKGPPPQAIAPSTTTSTTPQPFMVKTTVKSVPLPPSNDASCASCRLPVKPEAETIQPTSAPDTATEIPPPFKVVSKDDQPTTEAPTTSLAEALPQKFVNDNPGNSKSRVGSDDENDRINALKQNSAKRDLLSNQASPNRRQPGLNEKLNSPQMFNKQGGNVEHYNKMENLMNGLLYRFDYATDFQGHREEGDRLGNKDGEYYSVGRDNIKRVVSYKANEFGFMPYIRQEPVSSQELQQLDERNNRLRHSKFEWFYT
jgi:hypothetical protein